MTVLMISVDDWLRAVTRGENERVLEDAKKTFAKRASKILYMWYACGFHPCRFWQQVVLVLA